MSNKFKPLDVEFEYKDAVVSFFSSVFKISELISFANKIFCDRGLYELNNNLTSSGQGRIPLKDNNKDEWLTDGVDCEILSPDTKGWQKGKARIKISFEFCPDEPEVEETQINNGSEISKPESPLDDIRKMISENN